MVNVMVQLLYLQKMASGTQWKGGWEGPTASLDNSEKIKIAWPCQDLNPGSSNIYTMPTCPFLSTLLNMYIV